MIATRLSHYHKYAQKNIWCDKICIWKVDNTFFVQLTYITKTSMQGRHIFSSTYLYYKKKHKRKLYTILNLFLGLSWPCLGFDVISHQECRVVIWMQLTSLAQYLNYDKLKDKARLKTHRTKFYKYYIIFLWLKSFNV